MHEKDSFLDDLVPQRTQPTLRVARRGQQTHAMKVPGPNDFSLLTLPVQCGYPASDALRSPSSLVSNMSKLAAGSCSLEVCEHERPRTGAHVLG